LEKDAQATPTVVRCTGVDSWLYLTPCPLLQNGEGNVAVFQYYNGSLTGIADAGFQIADFKMRNVLIANVRST
jgi:hypothetical protein